MHPICYVSAFCGMTSLETNMSMQQCGFVPMQVPHSSKLDVSFEVLPVYYNWVEGHTILGIRESEIMQ